MFESIKNKRILITGAGSLAHGIAENCNNELAVMSRNEASQFAFLEKFKPAKSYVGDIKDKSRLSFVLKDFKPHIIIHTAACKRVEIAQLEPINTVKNNILGSLNVIEAAYENNVECCINIDTDKSVNSQTYYGHSKNLASAMFLDMNRLGVTKYSVVRYGNVLCSRASVGIIWGNAAKAKLPLKLTNPLMTRFYFTILEGVKLIDYALKQTITNPQGHGKIYCTEMCAGTLEDLADIIIEKYENKSIKEVIGSRVSAEKIHEMLISELELKDTIRTDDYYEPFYSKNKRLHYFIISPFSNKSNISVPFTSDNAPKLTKVELLSMYDYAINHTYQN